MSKLFLQQRRVEFCETDAAGIVHFSTFFLYMEQAEHALLRSLGLSVVSTDEEGLIGWPRVRSECDYLNPLRFEDVFDIVGKVIRLGTKSVTYEFEFSLKGMPIARGLTTCVCCRSLPDGSPRSVEIPAAFRAKLEPYRAQSK